MFYEYVLCFMFYVLCFMFYVLCFMFYVLQTIATWIKLKLNRSVSQSISRIIAII